ncbi:MAG: hypothetical protein E7577_01350 [Ruminococcaceae bacterium]|nr:hypothetical protein [Oscillospiraceae bacterium]
MTRKNFLRVICLCFALILLSAALTSCESKPLSPTSAATREVGTVGTHAVYYDELYTLSKNLYEEGMTEDELRERVYSEIVVNYAKLTLCEQSGVSVDEEKLNEDVQTAIDSAIENDFGGNRFSYIKNLKSINTTDRYARFLQRVDVIYNQLEYALISRGELTADESEVTEYIKEKFVNVQCFMIANNEGDNIETNYSDALAARDALVNERTTFYDLIGGRYKLPGGSVNEDVDVDCIYTFGKGTMNKVFEDAAYALEVGEYSEVITIEDRELASGEIADCYYVIKRLPLTSEDVAKNYTALYNEYANTVINAKLTAVINELTFVPNEYGASLTLTQMERVSVGIDTFTITVTAIVLVVLALVAVAIVFIVIFYKKKKNALLEEKKERAKRALAARSKKDEK